MATQVEAVSLTETTNSTTPAPTPAATEDTSCTCKRERTKKMRTEKLCFAGMSKEIKEVIIEQVTRPSDLKNICLVNKQLHEIAVRFLYRSVSLDLGGPNDTRLPAFLNHKNIGLKHIKQLRLYLASVYDDCKQEQLATLASRMILEFLPENTLEEFRYAPTVNTDHSDDEDDWCPWKPFSADTLLLLYRTQCQMKWLEVMDLDRDILPDLKKNPRLQPKFQSVKKLALYPENRETLELGGFFVEKTKEQLEELIVHCNFCPAMVTRGDVLDVRELNDSATGPGLVSRTIFSCMTPFDRCTPFEHLRSLRLHRVSLRYCADTWCNFVKFHNLQFLRLYQCSGVDSLLGQLSKSSHLPKQLKVLEIQHRDNSENETLIALDGFLCLVSGIRDLIIDLEHVKSMPAAAGIARHGKTLELLNVHCTDESRTDRIPMDSDGDELVWEIEDFTKICKACPSLEQLSCAWPSTSLIRSPSDDWRSFENACGHLQKMVTLHITTWPNNKPSTQLLPRAIYETMLQALAQRGFELAAGTHTSLHATPPPPLPPLPPYDPAHDHAVPPDHLINMNATDPCKPAALRVIAFGTSDKIYEREDSKTQIIFLRSSARDAEGRPKVHATPVGWCARQYLEPRSDVLDFVLHQAEGRGKNHGPPCREVREAWEDHEDE